MCITSVWANDSMCEVKNVPVSVPVWMYVSLKDCMCVNHRLLFLCVSLIALKSLYCVLLLPQQASKTYYIMAAEQIGPALLICEKWMSGLDHKKRGTS